MKKVLLIATGGTISSIEGANGLYPQLTADELLSCCPDISGFCEAKTVQLFNLDSTNVRPEHWLKIAECIRNNYNDFDGFVITHGTDTMAYTAAALSYLIQNSRKPIIITGAQKPINLAGSDAIQNLTDSFLCASSDELTGVNLVFFGSVIAGTRARKNFSKSFAAFGSINHPEIASIRDGRLIIYIPSEISGEPIFFDSINENVGLVKFVPGMRADVLRYIIDQYDGLVVETFGVGGLPEYSHFYEEIKRAVELGKTVVLTTQVSNEGSNLSVYKVGAYLKSNFNILEAHDMTTEAAFCKLMWILGITNDFKEQEKLFYKTIYNDILYK